MSLRLKSNSYTNRFIFFLSVMANILSLRTLLDSDKLIGSNFDSWNRKLKIILEHKKILYILIDKAPEEPTTNAPRVMRDTYMKWLNDRTTVHCMMRTAMNDEFNRKFEDAQPEEIIQMLNESFDTPEDAERHKISCTIPVYEGGLQSSIIYCT